MDWNRTLRAAMHRRAARTWMLNDALIGEVAAFTSLVVLESEPSPPNALIVASRLMATPLDPLPGLVLSPALRRAIAAWRRHPSWLRAAIGDDRFRRLTWGVARAIAVFRHDAAARNDAIDVILRDGDAVDVARCVKELGESGWQALDDARRDALFSAMRRSAICASGTIWPVLSEARQAAVVDCAVARPQTVAPLIGAIGAPAWQATTPALRRRLIAAAAEHLDAIAECAAAWDGMDDDEIDRIVAAVVAAGRRAEARSLLDRLDCSGRKRLTDEQRAALETLAREVDPWSVILMRGMDYGWNGLTQEERNAALQAAAWGASPGIAALRRAIVGDERTAMTDVARNRLTGGERCPIPSVLDASPFRWRRIANGTLPPIADDPSDEPTDAPDGGIIAKGIYRLPAEQRAFILNLAPWMIADIQSATGRAFRLAARWRAMADDERVAFVREQPLNLPSVAVAARWSGDGDAAGAVVAVICGMAVRAAAAQGDISTFLLARRVAGAQWPHALHIAESSGPMTPQERTVWRLAAQRGWVADPARCATLIAAPSTPCRRIRRQT